MHIYSLLKLLAMFRFHTDFRDVQTPCYYYDQDLLARTINAAKTAAGRYDYTVHYALKANSNYTILRQIFDAGLGADCVSGNELRRAVEMGVMPNKIALAGVGKTDFELELAIQEGIFAINVESLHELEVIGEITDRLGLPARISLRINPNVDAKTHKHITTGLKGNKFGMARADIQTAIGIIDRFDGLQLKGLHFHIGSQITDMQPFVELCAQVNDILRMMEALNIELDHLNLGGGLGVNYESPDAESIPDFEAFFASIYNNLQTSLPVHFELGRSIVAQCGALVTRVLFEKESMGHDFLIVDAGMTELMRPALYNAYHKVEKLTEQGRDARTYNVVGPVCESTDSFGTSVELEACKRGDILVIRTSGAYGESMASSYNLRELQTPVFSSELTVSC